MPTFEDPAQDADELGEAARGLAYATRHISVPEDTYRVLGSMHYALTSVQQSLRQLADWHERRSPFAATDDGNRTASQEHAAKASGWLTIAAASMDQVVQLVMAAQSENGRIAWQPEPSPLDRVLQERSASLDPETPATGEAREDARRRLQ
ncbi:hypothetical protein [Microbacterium sp. 18062]|uniref:hypothetical protein n=1 Tax=Microbacterium sp. 18062 TaxID=2681410 RepID=UPI0013572A80|nr:hypothetical protein [Microbacterium sp. 18062]